jgi:hypothetical protein
MITIDTLNRIEETLSANPKDPYALKELHGVEKTDKQVKKLVKAIRRQRNWIAAREAKLDEMRIQLQDLLEASGQNWADDVGYARLIPESKRVSYESKSIDALIITQPDIYGCLAAYRRESKIRASVQVK